MILEECRPYISKWARARSKVTCSILLVLFAVNLVGCGDQVKLPSEWELAQFRSAGPAVPSVDTERLVKARMSAGPYRVGQGDALELTMPGIMWFVATKEGGNNMELVTPYLCRVAEDGTITLPLIGQVQAAGKTLSQIESDVVQAYYPKHIVTRPSVFARVLEYGTTKVSITGAVLSPGIYELRSDQMSLVALIMEAGGIIDEGASRITITHYDGNSDGKPIVQEEPAGGVTDSDRTSAKPLALPIRGLNIPFADVALEEGDSVVVERLEPPMITVMGLVSSPGNFPYPLDARYNLMQALAFAGGLNQVAEPRYATVYRLNSDGKTVSAVFRIKDGSKLAEAANTRIRPGDIIDVQQTPRTRTALFLDRVFRINVGAYWRIEDGAI